MGIIVGAAWLGTIGERRTYDAGRPEGRPVALPLTWVLL
jgi:hypothetical protein